MNSYLAAKEARDAGFDDAIMLNSRGYVSEGSGANIFIVKNGHLLTPGYSSDILDGVTRAHVIRLAHDLKIPVAERTIARGELYTADELFFCGTGVEISPIGRVDHVTIGERALLTAGSLVIGQVPPGEKWGGNPARPWRSWLRMLARLERMGRDEVVGESPPTAVNEGDAQ